jgi:hypothetical protein
MKRLAGYICLRPQLLNVEKVFRRVSGFAENQRILRTSLWESPKFNVTSREFRTTDEWDSLSTSAKTAYYPKRWF